jgi:RNA polymerase sigma-70 factor (family 1)
MLDFELFFKEQYPKLCYFATRILPDNLEVEDLVQDAFIKYHHRRENFDSENAAVSFLYITIRNDCFNLIRHQKVVSGYKKTLEIAPVENSTALQEIIRSEALGEIHKAIEELPAGCRNIFKLSYFEKLKNQEIADLLQVSINTIKTQKQRALQLLRLKLNPEVLVFLISIFCAKFF